MVGSRAGMDNLDGKKALVTCRRYNYLPSVVQTVVSTRMEPTVVRGKTHLNTDEESKILWKIHCRCSGSRADLKNPLLDKPDALLITNLTQMYHYF
jgi:hypothetical protein